MLRRLSLALLLVAFSGLIPAEALAQATRPTLYWGSRGDDVRVLQARLRAWGYYRGPVDGVFGAETSEAVRFFQRRNGLPADGVVGPRTWAALGLARTGTAVVREYRPATSATPVAARGGTVDLLARLIAAEAEGEPYAGMVAVGAVVLNRIRDPRFPGTLSGVIFQPGAFESVMNGLIWRRTPSPTAYRAAQDALNGWDPTGGALFFWNPFKQVNPWVWARQIIARIGRHVFAR